MFSEPIHATLVRQPLVDRDPVSETSFTPEAMLCPSAGSYADLGSMMVRLIGSGSKPKSIGVTSRALLAVERDSRDAPAGPASRAIRTTARTAVSCTCRTHRSPPLRPLG